MAEAPTTELIRRFDRNGPRYTSYPTADRFDEGFGANALAAWLARRGRHTPGQPLGVYVHVPFCTSICYYCACNKIGTRDAAKGARYVDTLLAEADLYAGRLPGARPIRQLHLGGGTPTFLDDATMQRLLDGLAARFGFTDDAERSIEVDPRTVDGARLGRLRAQGFDRISFGVQDLDPAVQKAVNRVQAAEEIAAIIEVARTLGFASINVDLIYGLPKQTPASMAQTIDAIATMRPDRIALYAYAHLPQRFKPQRRIDAAALPPAEAKLQMMRQAIDQLGDAGYVHIGMDHFALPDDSLARALREGTLNRNFMGYTTLAEADLIGLGVSAIGAIGPTYAQNHRALPAYTGAVEAGELPIARGIELTAQDLLCRTAIMGIMCKGLLDFAMIAAAFEVDSRRVFRRELAELAEFAEWGLVDIDDAGVRVTEAGRFFLRPIAMVFDRHLQQQRTTAIGVIAAQDMVREAAQYSRLI